MIFFLTGTLSVDRSKSTLTNVEQDTRMKKQLIPESPTNNWLEVD